ncbi:hypothetical protein HPB51_025507 [Rhipicephalus microplus]|uniref:Uncharacterized protein n=1 Tax=Rhipicephalus microplus TaxID=6941 RepID=A0A9J6E5I8_RHIMP|nr:hypothetical protein HPB51_025507 [Rhipicephalus microplus]
MSDTADDLKKWYDIALVMTLIGSMDIEIEAARTSVHAISLSNDDVWRYLHFATSTVHQAHRGWSFKEEGYVKHLKLNLQTSDDELGLT